MSGKISFLAVTIVAVVFLAAVAIIPLVFYPRAVSWVFSYKKECRVLRVEPFMKGFNFGNVKSGEQMNKFSIICEDGFVCRADDTGFAGVKPGDFIEFRAFPEFKTVEEFGKCDHAQLNKIFPGKEHLAEPAAPPATGGAAPAAGAAAGNQEPIVPSPPTNVPVSNKPKASKAK